jgi:predicted metal-dependent peptidase
MSFRQALDQVEHHPLLGPLYLRATIARWRGDTRVPAGQWAVVTSGGYVICHPTRRGEQAEWVYVLAHCLLHLGLGHVPFSLPASVDAWCLAADVAVEEFLDPLRLGRKPSEYELDLGDVRLPRNFHDAYAELYYHRGGVPVRPLPDLRFEGAPRYAEPHDFPAALAVGVRQAVESAIAQAAGAAVDEWGNIARPESTVARARDWFVSSFPLLGALAASFELIEDRALCARLDIRVAAVDASEKRLYFNPLAGLSELEARFVMAHEFLHVALRHHARLDGRDPYLWNVAADYAINLWLEEMGVGEPPSFGLLLDRSLKGMSAESIYDRIVKDLRVMRRRATFRDTGKGDMLDGPPEWWSRGAGVELDDFYRSALAQGLANHHTARRGLLPAGLEEEIRAQTQPPIPWEVRLADWFDAFFSPLETRRSYQRPSRRQSATPGIPRPRVVLAESALDGRTFGVVLDTSGSMDRVTLARGLGAVASYALSREVPAVRVVFCDADAYDAGYMPAEAIGGRVRVRGRGGTVLQPGIDLLREADDFPALAPVLIITDTFCESTLRVPGEHAFLVPAGRRLPFPPKGPVFTMPPSQAEER